MNDIYEKNLFFLKKYHPDEYSIYNKNKVEIKKYSLYKTDSGTPVPVDIIQKKMFYDKTNPLTALKKTLSEIKKESPFYIIFGFGLGYHIRVLRTMLPRTLFIILENDLEMFELALQSVSLSDIFSDKNNILILKETSASIWTKIETKIGGIYVINQINSINFSQDAEYDKIASILNGTDKLPGLAITLEERADKNISTLSLFKKDWIKNITDNIENYLTVPGIKYIYNLFSGKPCIITGAGPSLDRDAPYIKKIKNKILIIAVDTSVKTLINNDVIPDIIITIDPSSKNINYLQDISASSILISELCIPYSITSKFKNNILFFHGQHSLSSFLSGFVSNSDSTVAVGSVSCNAFDLSCKLGCNPVIFSGLDFGYYKNKSHCKTAMKDYTSLVLLDKFKTPESVVLNKINENTKHSGNNSGITTNPTFLNWKSWFEVQIKHLRKLNYKFINISQYGLNIKGTARSDISTVINRYSGKNLNFIKKIKERINSSKPSSAEYRKDKNIFFKKNIIKAEKSCSLIKKRIRQNFDIISSIRKESNIPHNKIDKIDYNINSIFRNNNFAEINKWSLFLLELEYRKIPVKKSIKTIDCLYAINCGLKKQTQYFDNIINKLKTYFSI